MPHMNHTALVIAALLINHLHLWDVLTARMLGLCSSSKEHIEADYSGDA